MKFCCTFLPTSNSGAFSEILTFLTGSTALLYQDRGRGFADLPLLLASGETSPPIYLSAETGHEFSTRQFPHQTLQVCHNWAKALSCQNEIQCWAIPDSYPLWSFYNVSVQPLRNFSSQSSKNPPALLTARVEAPKLWASYGRGEVPRCLSSLTMAGRSRNRFILTEGFALLLHAFPFLPLLWKLLVGFYFFFFFFFKLKLENKTMVSSPVAIQPWQKTEKPRWRRGKLSALHNFVWHLFIARRKVLSFPNPPHAPPRFNSQALSAWSCFSSTHLLANLHGCHIITAGQNSRASNIDNELNLVWEISAFLLSCRINFISH